MGSLPAAPFMPTRSTPSFRLGFGWLVRAVRACLSRAGLLAVRLLVLGIRVGGLLVRRLEAVHQPDTVDRGQHQPVEHAGGRFEHADQ
jgi:hypothetical protein